MNSIEQKEERLHKDLNGDGEKGESASHRRKVLKKEPTMAKKNPFVPQTAGKPSVPPFMKTGSAAMPKPAKGAPKPPKSTGKSSSKKMCAPCMKSNASSCSHM